MCVLLVPYCRELKVKRTQQRAHNEWWKIKGETNFLEKEEKKLFGYFRGVESLCVCSTLDSRQEGGRHILSCAKFSNLAQKGSIPLEFT
jgi:hypothetical protein